MLVTSIFSFSQTVVYPMQEKNNVFSNVQNSVILESVNNPNKITCPPCFYFSHNIFFCFPICFLSYTRKNSITVFRNVRNSIILKRVNSPNEITSPPCFYFSHNILLLLLLLLFVFLLVWFRTSVHMCYSQIFGSRLFEFRRIEKLAIW